MEEKVSIIKLTNIEELIRRYEEKKRLSKSALENFSIENQIQGYIKLLNEIEDEKQKLERLIAHADVLDLKNPIRAKRDVYELKIRLLELEKSIYDRLKDFRSPDDTQLQTAIVNINIRTTSVEEPEDE